eukprot:7559829-Karenia_brevis.AAC.1
MMPLDASGKLPPTQYFPPPPSGSQLPPTQPYPISPGQLPQAQSTPSGGPNLVHRVAAGTPGPPGGP